MGEKGEKLTSESSKSAEDLQNRLAKLCDIRIKKMFGGHGIFEQDKMFALIDSKGRVFFKIDDTNQSRFEEAGSEKHARMPYYRVPEEVLGDDELLEEWAQISIKISKGLK
ncbi:MAG: TfoX/Sxy family protein [Desulfobacterales bacterium]|nr:TfoX/Sxy family protein [Desulfobacterales bacterium]